MIDQFFYSFEAPSFVILRKKNIELRRSQRFEKNISSTGVPLLLMEIVSGREERRDEINSIDYYLNRSNQSVRYCSW